MKRLQLLGIDISLGSYDSFINTLIEEARARKSCYVCLANVHMLVEAHNSPSFASVLNNARMVIPDGKPLIWALQILFGVKQERVAGMDLLPDLLFAADKHKISVAFYGGTDEILHKTLLYLKKGFPNINIVKMYSPPFRPLNDEESSDIIKMFNESGAEPFFLRKTSR